MTPAPTSTTSGAPGFWLWIVSVPFSLGSVGRVGRAAKRHQARQSRRCTETEAEIAACHAVRTRHQQVMHMVRLLMLFEPVATPV
jgi:hypothetical protein